MYDVFLALVHDASLISTEQTHWDTSWLTEINNTHDNFNASNTKNTMVLISLGYNFCRWKEDFLKLNNKKITTK